MLVGVSSVNSLCVQWSRWVVMDGVLVCVVLIGCRFMGGI